MNESMESYWSLVKPLFEEVNLDDPESFYSSIAAVPRPNLLLFAAHFCLSEVHNGGILQFFWNSTGMLAPEAVEGFKAIGMPELAALLEKAAAPLGTPFPRDRDDRWDALLGASEHDEEELRQIFEGTSHFYLAFAKATESLSFDALSKKVWELADTENGGFQEAATRYAQSL